MDKADIQFVASILWTVIWGLAPIYIAPRFSRWREKRKYQGKHRKN